MRANPNFISNFSDGNMTDSVKIADYGASDHEGALHKQFLSYAGGGRGQYDANQQKEKVSAKFELPNTKPIKTQQSQVDAFQTGFKKNKDAERAITLNELRSEFDYIRNMQPAEHKQQEKISSSSEQSRRSNRRLEDDSSSSISSSKIKQKQPINNNREERLWHVERKQYEFMLNNCQLKIQELLHSQMEYKKIIHELRTSNALTKAPIENKSNNEIRDLQRQLKQQKQKNFQLTSQLEKVRSNLKQITEKTTKLQSQYNYRSKDEYKLSDEKRKVEQYLRLQKDRYMNCQIEKRKYQMENELLIKQRQQEVSRMQRQMEHQGVLHELNLKNLIKKYDDQIQIKDRRYMLLLSQFEKLKKDYAYTKAEAEKPNNSNAQFIEIFKRLLDERKNNQGEELNRTLTNLILKFQQGKEKDQSSSQSSSSSSSQQQDQNTQRLLSEIRILKAEVQALKNGSGQGIDLQPMKKMYEAQVAALKDTIAILQRKLKNISRQQPSPQIHKNPLSNLFSQAHVNQLQKRILELQASSKQTNPNSQENEQMIANFKQKLQAIDQQLRGQRRKRNEIQFQLSKVQKQLQFRTSLITNEKQSIIRVKQSQLDRANQNIIYWREQFENMRKFYEQKMFEKNKLLEQSMNTVQVTTIQQSYNESLDKARLGYEKQISQLAERLANYNSSSLEYNDLLKKYTALEVAYFDLQKFAFRIKQSNESVDQLWYIKQTEYGNVNQILNQLKGGRPFLRSAPSAQLAPPSNLEGLGVGNFKNAIESAILDNFNASQGYNRPQGINQPYMPSQPPSNPNPLTSSQQNAIQNQIHSSLAQIFNRGSTAQPSNPPTSYSDPRLSGTGYNNNAYGTGNSGGNFILDSTPLGNNNPPYNDPYANRASNFYDEPNANRGSFYQQPGLRSSGNYPNASNSFANSGNQAAYRNTGYNVDAGYGDPLVRNSKNYTPVYG